MSDIIEQLLPVVQKSVGDLRIYENEADLDQKIYLS